MPKTGESSRLFFGWPAPPLARANFLVHAWWPAYHAAMDNEVIRTKKILTGISPLSFEHPTDQAALMSLGKVPGIDRILKFAFRLIHERRARLDFLSSSVRVNEKQFPELHGYLPAFKRVRRYPPISASNRCCLGLPGTSPTPGVPATHS